MYFVELSWFNDETEVEDKPPVHIVFDFTDDLFDFCDKIQYDQETYDEYEQPYDMYVYWSDDNVGVFSEDKKFTFVVWDLKKKVRI